MKCPFCKGDVREWDLKKKHHLVITEDVNRHIHVHGDLHKAADFVSVVKKECGLSRDPVTTTHTPSPSTSSKKLIFRSGLSPGDILMLTIAVRDLHVAYPGEYITDVRTPCPEIWENNPYITPLDEEKDKDVVVIEMMYPSIHRSGWRGHHFSEGYRRFLEKVLDRDIPAGDMIPDIHLSEDETKWANQVATKYNYAGKFWLIDAGHKRDYPLKGYPPEKWQRAVNLLSNHIQLVQIGHPGTKEEPHDHPELEGVWSLVGETDLRQLIRLFYWAEGIISCVSLPMVLAAAFRKPAVVLAGAREGSRWQMYPGHRFLYTNGAVPCATWDGCWHNTYEECPNRAGGIPKCFHLIRPEDIVNSVQMYYEGGVLSHGGPPTKGPIL